MSKSVLVQGKKYVWKETDPDRERKRESGALMINQAAALSLHIILKDRYDTHTQWHFIHLSHCGIDSRPLPILRVQACQDDNHVR